MRSFTKFFMGVRDRREDSASSSRQEHLYMVTYHQTIDGDTQ